MLYVRVCGDVAMLVRTVLFIIYVSAPQVECQHTASELGLGFQSQAGLLTGSLLWVGQLGLFGAGLVGSGLYNTFNLCYRLGVFCGTKPRVWYEVEEGPYRPLKWHLYDYLGLHEKNNLDNLMNDMVVDAKLKMRQMYDLKKEHESLVSFNVGLIIGKIRERYRLLLQIYRMAQDFRHERMVFTPTGIKHRYIRMYLHFQEFIHRHEYAIDKLVNVLEQIPEYEFFGKDMIVSPEILTGFRGRRQMQEVSDKLEQKLEMAENQVKANFRRQYMMKQLGAQGQPPHNESAAKKGFVNKWPVSDTWSENFEQMY